MLMLKMAQFVSKIGSHIQMKFFVGRNVQSHKSRIVVLWNVCTQRCQSQISIFIRSIQNQIDG